MHSDSELIEYGKFKSKGLETYEKQYETVLFVLDKIRQYQEQGKVKVYIEDIQLQANVHTFKTLAQLQGAVIVSLKGIGVDEIEIISAATWKSFSQIGGRGRAEQKRNAQKYILENYKKKVTQDEADAILLGRYAANQGFDWS